MEITSLKFAFLAIASVIVFYLLKPRHKTLYLAILSCGFIASFNYNLLIYVIGYSVVNYLIGIKLPGAKYKSSLFRAGIIVNLSQLIILRYAAFAIDPIIHLFNGQVEISTINEIILPIGISYYTLQGIGYLINVKMGWEKPEVSLIRFFLYISFFPKFLSGPIERSNHFLPQLSLFRSFDQEAVISGLRIALFGFFKKIAIANQLATIVNNTYSDVNSMDGSMLWIVLLIQPIYLYFDFSGYSDIAIGFSRAFGINILPNFNRPFFSENVSTFWKRFHMSLSLWFNDYIFRQVSFKRRRWGIYASTYAVFLTFTLFGIWHGAGWTFMILGLLQAIAINYEFFTKRWRLRLFSWLPSFLRIWLGRLITYLFYCGSLVFFFSHDIEATLNFFTGLFTINGSFASVILNYLPLGSLAVIIIYLTIELFENDHEAIALRIQSIWSGEKIINIVLRWITYYAAIISILVLGTETQQFIYFKF